MGWAAGQKWSKVHRGDIDLNSLADSITTKISDTIPILGEGIAALVATKNMALTAKPSEVIAQIAIDNQLSTGGKGQALQAVDAFLNHEKGFRNLFGIINSITRMAQTQDAADQFKLEEIGGNLSQLNQGQWTRLNQMGMNIKPDKLNRIYGIVSAT